MSLSHYREQPIALPVMPDRLNLPDPADRWALTDWIAKVALRNRAGRCWRCGLTRDEIEQLGADADHWTLHLLVDGGPITAQSCCRGTADLIENFYDKHFTLLKNLV